jgi:hypothetical protein
MLKWLCSISAATIALVAAVALAEERSEEVTAAKGGGAAFKPGNQLSDRDRQRLEEAGPAVVKGFVAALRRRFDEKSAGELRKYLDPRYLKEHKLREGALPIQTVVTKAIYANYPTDDPQTLLVVVETEAATKEAMLFRTSVYEENVYILPLAAPDARTRSFNPWILRAKL